MNIVISDKTNFKSILKSLKKGGLNNLHVVADFDRTLTYGSVNGKKTSSLIATLADDNHLSRDYSKKAQALFDKYHPIELDANLSLDFRKAKMMEWWQLHNQLLVDSGLNFSDFESIAKSPNFKFREGVLEFLDFLHENEVPLIVLSASGVGEAIKLFFKRHNKDYPNIYYITNRFYWDENGKAIAPKGMVIHSLNKHETILSEIESVNNAINNRKNVVLLGDSIGDLGMVEGFDYDTLLKIGFLNLEYNNNHQDYFNNFDLVLVGDGDFHYVNKLFCDLQ